MTSRTGNEKFHEHCELCEHFRLAVQLGGGCLELCSVTGEQLVWRYGDFIKSNRCPFKEVKNV